MLKGKTVLLGVSGSIAAYKAAQLTSLLKKQEADVHVLMTKNGTEFITPLTFETLTGNKCHVDTFDRNFKFDVEHIELAKKADLIIVAPATANVIGKFAYGIADDMLTTTVLASKAPKIIAPTMNTNMYENPITQENINKLESLGIKVIEPASGLLACKDIGKGKMPEPELLLEYIMMEIAREKDLLGKRVLITAGATMEAIDPVRYITNHSTGKMGIAIAKECAYRGANVTLVAASVSEEIPKLINTIRVRSAEEMYDEVDRIVDSVDFVFKAAAVADYTPKEVYQGKVKKKDEDLSIPLKRTKDILKEMGYRKNEKQVFCGFSMETENLILNSSKKLESKNADIIVANCLRDKGAGFGTDTNLVTFITKEGREALELMHKQQVAAALVDKCIEIAKDKNY
ncbi:MAG: bifunctional phosphopantothenoylcysteine decarboxylase/phosphopantothenate--cysteine ligase CoaBC [Anaerovoracaceae bacterium]